MSFPKWDKKESGLGPFISWGQEAWPLGLSCSVFLSPREPFDGGCEKGAGRGFQGCWGAGEIHGNLYRGDRMGGERNPRSLERGGGTSILSANLQRDACRGVGTEVPQFSLCKMGPRNQRIQVKFLSRGQNHNNHSLSDRCICFH